MISLRKTMETQADELARSTVDAYLSALNAMSAAGTKACPSAAEALQQGLSNLSARLAAERSPSSVVETGQRLEQELDVWSKAASAAFRAKTDAVKEILQILANAALQVGAQDQRNSARFRNLTDRLSATAQLNDLTAIRESLHGSVKDLRASVFQMTEDSRGSVENMKATLESYEARLKEAEQDALTDPLTGVANRRMVEREFEVRARAGRPFSLLYFDLNGFKNVNDRLGHLAGDSLLQQFAEELRGVFRTGDVVGRMGGDEFVALISGDRKEAEAGLERIAKWVHGESTVRPGASAPVKVTVTAAGGSATWRPGMSFADLLKLADKAMYANKP